MIINIKIYIRSLTRSYGVKLLIYWKNGLNRCLQCEIQQCEIFKLICKKSSFFSQQFSGN